VLSTDTDATIRTQAIALLTEYGDFMAADGYIQVYSPY